MASQVSYHLALDAIGERRAPDRVDVLGAACGERRRWHELGLERKMKSTYVESITDPVCNQKNKRAYVTRFPPFAIVE